MYQQFPHMNFSKLEGPKSSHMYGLADTGSRSNLGNIEYHQSVAERHPNLVLKCLYLKDLDDVDPFNIRQGPDQDSPFDLILWYISKTIYTF